MSTTRKITIVSTKNNKVKNYESDVTTWGDLNALITGDFDLSNLKATENINKTTLEHVDAVLPTGDFRVFLRPVKTKSGQDFSEMKFGELRATFKDDDAVKKFLTGKGNGRNWTQLKTDELRTFLTEYHSTAVSNVVESVKEAKTEAVTDDVKEEVAEIEEVPCEGIELNTTEKFQTAMQLLEEVIDEVESSDMDEDDVDEITYNIQEFIDSYKEEYSETLTSEFGEGMSTDKQVAKKAPITPQVKEETAEEKAEKARIAAEKAEEADALREAREFEDGFTS